MTTNFDPGQEVYFIRFKAGKSCWFFGTISGIEITEARGIYYKFPRLAIKINQKDVFETKEHAELEIARRNET
jgi:hypothetical protein